VAAAPDDRPTASGVAAEARARTIADLRGAPDFRDRVRAIRVLAGFADADAIAALIAALKDTSAEVAVEAAEALGHRRGARAIAALQETLDNRDGYCSPVARAAAVRALGKLLPPGQGLPVVAAVRDVDSTVSLAAIAALADRREDASASALRAVLDDTAGFYLPATRQAAARGLVRLGPLDATTWQTLIDKEPDAAVREVLVALQPNGPSAA
jgi:HEAT repeat protein